MMSMMMMIYMMMMVMMAMMMTAMTQRISFVNKETKASMTSIPIPANAQVKEEWSS